MVDITTDFEILHMKACNIIGIVPEYVSGTNHVHGSTDSSQSCTSLEYLSGTNVSGVSVWYQSCTWRTRLKTVILPPGVTVWYQLQFMSYASSEPGVVFWYQ